MNKMIAHMSIFDFQAKFPNDKACVDYLSELKWPNQYECRYCKNTMFCNTSRYEERQCTKCRKPESVTVHILFDKVNFH